MRTSNLGKGRRVAVLFRLCLAIMVLLTLAVGGLALNTQPVRAIGIDADPPGFTYSVAEGQPFSIQFTATAPGCTPPPDPFWWFWPSLPGYANLDWSTGLLTGCPQVGDPSATFIIGVSEFSFPPFCFNFHTQLVTINVIPPPAPCDMVIDPTFYPVAWENMPFSMPLTVTGGVGPFLWSATGLPAGLTVTDPVLGIISGTPAPGTCGIYTVTATCTDTGTCLCPPVNRDFILIVDCWANYLALVVTYSTTACDFTVEIGPGLTQGQTPVVIDGTNEATLAGGQSETFTSVPCESHLVMVNQTVQGSGPNTRFAVIGSNQKWVTDVDSVAYFDYRQEAFIQTGSDPPGVALPPGTGFYAIGSICSTTTPGTVAPASEKGVKYVFKEWRGPDGRAFPNRDVSFNVTTGGPLTAVYDTYYELQLKSDSPQVADSSWHLKGTDANWDLGVDSVPSPNFWGGLGAKLKPINGKGSIPMNGPQVVEIRWKKDCTIPAIIISVLVIVVAGLVYYFGFRRRQQLAPVAAAPAKKTKAPAKAKPEAKSNFCPKCGNRVGKDEDFCKKCGKKLK